MQRAMRAQEAFADLPTLPLGGYARIAKRLVQQRDQGKLVAGSQVLIGIRTDQPCALAHRETHLRLSSPNAGVQRSARRPRRAPRATAESARRFAGTTGSAGRVAPELRVRGPAAARHARRPAGWPARVGGATLPLVPRA